MAVYICCHSPVCKRHLFRMLESAGIRIAGSHRNYCGIKNDGIAYCWGGNDLGQLGSPGITVTRVPVPFGLDPAASS